MSYFTNEQKLNDVIFADRNKAYGAYVIRSSYGNTVFKSLSFMLITVGTVMSVTFLLNRKNTPDPESSLLPATPDTIYQIEVAFTPPEPPEELSGGPSAPYSDAPAESGSVTIVDETVATTETLSTEVTTTVINTSTLAEIPGNSTITSTTTRTGTVIGDTLGDAPRELPWVDSQPEFEGGLAGLYAFIKRNLKYPEPALDQGKEGTIHVRFVVDENGKVGSLKLRNNIGYGLDDEAIRVVSLIPNFKTPALVKGKPVKSYYQIPIRFRLR